jgi:hypothetical protein
MPCQRKFIVCNDGDPVSGFSLVEVHGHDSGRAVQELKGCWCCGRDWGLFGGEVFG